MVANPSTPNRNDSEPDPLRLLTEDVIPLKDVPAELPNRVDVSSVWRWAMRGVGGIRLETVKVGGKKLTSRQAVTRFIRATSRN
ncbi:DUF1580 domain-containing protein [Novipirellula artificiosorum]|uniref:DUF1580 domain-containing protein n=1 Tax=Novipirellula artificiosorum TaxID=2528016 RepID=A0A5C6CSJ6_9BACT|nr:DUF1580 domain-containing protein [Novipirellula artificiosorum]TWU27923.1 hypothetical protein Poly41_70420 [Novipirellula artificiosorum]